MPKNILVVGVPRSGTSMTSAVFVKKGYHLGWIEKDYQRLGDERNPFGYFEADDVIAHNIDVLKRVGFPDDNTWLRAMISEPQIEAIARLEPTPEHRRFVERYSARGPWVWKDPRLCLTLPYWWKLMDPTSTAVVLTRRQISDVVRSFRVMKWYGSGEAAWREAVFRIERHLLAAEEAIARLGIPHARVHYADYFRDPGAVARRLGALAELDLTAEDLNVRSGLRHDTLRGRALAGLRVALDTGPLRPIRPLRRLVPRPLLRAVFPEKRYAPRSTPGQS